MQIEVGAVLEGKVTGITKFGAFITFPDGKTGMVHISEISQGFVKEVKDYLQMEQAVTVKVIGIDANGKVALSLKQAQTQTKAAPEHIRPRPHREPPKPTGAAPDEYSVYKRDAKKAAAAPEDPFEAMMVKFKSQSTEKISDLKKNVDSKRSNAGFSRRNTNKY